MKFRVLGCSGGRAKGHFLSSFLLNDRISIDAGSLSGSLTLEEQLTVRHVVLSHSHLDHICELPFFLDNIFEQSDQSVFVYGTSNLIQDLKENVFNDKIWPDFTKLSSHDKPALIFKTIELEKPFLIDELVFTPIAVEHITPTVGFLIAEESSTIIYTSDTGPTDRIWALASSQKQLKAIVTEISFSNEAHELARSSGHMTPNIFAEELAKVKKKTPIFITHTKPSHLRKIQTELSNLNLDNVTLIEQNKTYFF